MAPVTTRMETDFGFVPDIGHLTMFGLCVDCAPDPETANGPQLNRG